METDTHAALLAELPEESKPKYHQDLGDGRIFVYSLAPRLDGYAWSGRPFLRPIDIPATDAHAHIERAAWKRVRAWCDGMGSPTVIRGCQICYYSDGMLVEIGTGPDDATALLAACRFINEQEKR